MIPRSSNPSGVVVGTSSSSVSRNDLGPANPDDIHQNIQQCLDRKDFTSAFSELRSWSRLLYAAAPGSRTLQLTGLDLRGLGDFAERLTPDVLLPVLVLRDGDLVGQDHRIERLTAHPSLHGLEVQGGSMTIQTDDTPAASVWTALANGARTRWLQHGSGLKQLRWTSNESFRPFSGNPQFLFDYPSRVVRDEGLRLLLQHSPALESVHISGTVAEGVYLDMAHALEFLPRTAVEHLCLERCNPFCFSGDVDGAEWGQLGARLKTLDVRAWAWFTRQTGDDEYEMDGQVACGMLGLHACSGNPDLVLRVTDLHRAPIVGQWLAAALDERTAPVRVIWTATGAHQDVGFTLFCNRAMNVTGQEECDWQPEAVSVELHCNHHQMAANLSTLASWLLEQDDSTRLSVDGCRTSWAQTQVGVPADNANIHGLVMLQNSAMGLALWSDDQDPDLVRSCSHDTHIPYATTQATFDRRREEVMASKVFDAPFHFDPDRTLPPEAGHILQGIVNSANADPAMKQGVMSLIASNTLSRADGSATVTALRTAEFNGLHLLTGSLPS